MLMYRSDCAKQMSRFLLCRLEYEPLPSLPKFLSSIAFVGILLGVDYRMALAVHGYYCCQPLESLVGAKAMEEDQATPEIDIYIKIDSHC